MTFNFAQVRKVADEISATIDFQQSAFENRVVVCKNSSQSLFELSTFYNSLPELLSETAREIDIPNARVVYFPQLGFFITLDSSNEKPSGYELRVFLFK